MDKNQLKQELRLAYEKKKYKEDMLNYVEREFVDTVIYEIKAIDCKISALLKMIDKAEEPKVNASKFWNGYILSCVNVPIGAKKEISVARNN